MNKKKYSFDLSNGKTCTLEILDGNNIVYYNLILSKRNTVIKEILLTKEEFFAFIDCYHDSRVDLDEVESDT